MKVIFFTVFLIASLTQINAQELDFPCDSNFNFYGHNWVDKDRVAIYDKLNDIDYSETALEIRFWTYAAGQIGMLNEAIILRKPVNNTNWEPFIYSGFESGSNHKSMAAFFYDNEIHGLKKSEIRKKVTVLLENDILILEEPTYESFLPIIDLRGLSTSHGTTYTVEILSEGCARKYSIGSLWSNLEELQDMEVILKFNTIKSIFMELRNKGN